MAMCEGHSKEVQGASKVTGPTDGEARGRQGPPTGASGMSDREVYNVVADTVAGVNFRPKDNALQALAIVAFVVVGALVGCFLDPERIVGAFIGGFLGLVTGLLASGVFLMVYRFAMHLLGRHQ
jgi:hypothetical protein